MHIKKERNTYIGGKFILRRECNDFSDTVRVLICKLTAKWFLS